MPRISRFLVLTSFLAVLLIVWGNPISEAAPERSAKASPPEKITIEKIWSQKDGTKTVVFRDAQGNTQLAAIDCSGVSGLPGIAQLCGALDSGLDVLGTSITSSINSLIDKLREFLRKNSWEIIFNDVLNPLFQGLGDMLWRGSDPTVNNRQNPSSLIDQQSPQKLGIFPLKLVAAVYQNPPDLGTINSLSYVIDHNLLGLKPSLAAVTPGRLRLNPMFAIWEGMRNVAYLLITLMLIAYGFLVMMRQKIDPRTVVTVQSAIPRLAIGLLAIAFSYTIASLAVDIGQVGLASATSFFSSLPNRLCVTGAPCPPFPYLDSPLSLHSQGLAPGVSGPKGFGIFDGLVDMILGFVIWYMFFQIFFALITNYAQIFVGAALGPILITIGVLPSQSDAIKRWFMGLLSSALVFPGIYFILNIAVYIHNYEINLTLPDPIQQFDVKDFVVFGLIVLATKVPAIIQEALNAQPSGAVSRAGTDVGQVLRRIPVVGGLVG